MGDPKGFLKIGREVSEVREVESRVEDYAEHYLGLSEEKKRQQASRCMDCGVPFCMSGCPLGNMIPDFNDLVFKGKWREALRTLHATNNFPEFTGKICPAPCENSCVLGVIEPAVNIKNSEISIIEKAFESGWVVAQKPPLETGKTVAVVGAGPAGMACAQQLTRAGHKVTVFDKAPKPGGLMTYGIPEYKLPKALILRRWEILKEEGVEFCMSTAVGKDISWTELRKKFDAVAVCIGAEKARDLNVSGRELKGIHFAVEYLAQQNSRQMKEARWNTELEIHATGKDVVVIGGGDTGSDCIGNSLREKAKSVTNFELMEKAPETRASDNPWPQYARINRISSSVAENTELGGETEYKVATKEFLKDKDGNLSGVKTVKVEWVVPKEGGRPNLVEVEGSEKIYPAQLVLLAMGYLGPLSESLVKELGVELDERGNLKTNEENKMTSADGVFAAGDCRRGQSLVVWALAEGRDTAYCVDSYLMKRESHLPRVKTTRYLY